MGNKKTILPTPPVFNQDVPCRQAPDVFHPEIGDHRAAMIAKWICARCPVQQPCLEWALSDTSLEGIHAGVTNRQRQIMRRQRRR